MSTSETARAINGDRVHSRIHEKQQHLTRGPLAKPGVHLFAHAITETVGGRHHASVYASDTSPRHAVDTDCGGHRRGLVSRVRAISRVMPSRPGTLWIFSMMRASPERSTCNFEPLAAEDDVCRGRIGRTDFALHRVPEVRYGRRVLAVHRRRRLIIPTSTAMMTPRPIPTTSAASAATAVLIAGHLQPDRYRQRAVADRAVWPSCVSPWLVNSFAIRRLS